MDTKYFKKFDLEHAKDGAPIGLRNGADAHIDHFFSGKLIGWFSSARGAPFAAEWTPDGRHTYAGQEGRLDLVMRPLMMLEGRPVFVGDLLDSGGDPVPARIGMKNDAGLWRWAKETRKWPATALTANELCNMDNAALHGFQGNAYIAFANRIIAHECEAGNLVPAEEHKNLNKALERAERTLEWAGFRNIDGEWKPHVEPDELPKWVAADKLRPIVRGVLGQYGIDADGYALDAIITSVRAGGEPVKPAPATTMPEMVPAAMLEKVAVAVRDEAYVLCPASARYLMHRVDLPAIIASVRSAA